MWDILYLIYACGLRGERDISGFFVGGTRIMFRQKKGWSEKKI